MKTGKIWAKQIGTRLVLTTICLSSFFAHGAVMIKNPDKDETPVSIGKTIGQVTTALLGDAKKNIYFNRDAFPQGSTNTWATLGDKLAKFVKDYQPQKIEKNDAKFIRDTTSKFKNYGIEAINAINTIKNVHAYSAIQNRIVTPEQETKIAALLEPIKKISAETKATLKTLEAKIKKHKSIKQPQIQVQVIAGQKSRVQLSKIEEKLHNGFTSLDVILDAMIEGAKRPKFTAGLAQTLHGASTSK